MKKRIIGLAIMLVLLVTSFSSCGSSDDKTNDTATLKKVIEEKKPVNTVEPAPIDIKINKLDLESNSVGAPELYLTFTNTGDKDIVALNFWVTCYDAFGEVVKGNGYYDVFAGIDDAGIAVGGQSEGCWKMYGYETTKNVKIGIVKYKFEGEETVEIPAEEIVWVE